MSADRRHISPFQFSELPDGSMGLPNYPNMKLSTVTAQGTVDGRPAWEAELKMPRWEEAWESMARVRSETRRGRLTFIIMDESTTNLVGKPRLQPKLVSLSTVCSLELNHSGFIVGMLDSYVLGVDGRMPPGLTVTLPPELEGTFIIGQASLFDSPLSRKVEEGLQRNLFTHVCPIVWSPDEAPPGTGVLLQITLTTADYPGSPHSQVLSWSE